jgi:hypothetical protein
MTKKDYIIIARGLNAMVWNYQGEGVAQEILAKTVEILSNEFVHDNPRFDAEKFKEACYKK